MANHTFNSSNTRHNIERMLAYLATPHTYTEIEAALHMSPRSIRFYIEHLRAQDNRRVFLQAWRLIDGRYHAVFMAGTRKDAKQRKLTKAQQNAKWRARVKASDDLREREQKREQARWIVKKVSRMVPAAWYAPSGAVC